MFQSAPLTALQLVILGYLTISDWRWAAASLLEKKDSAVLLPTEPLTKHYGSRHYCGSGVLIVSDSTKLHRSSQGTEMLVPLQMSRRNPKAMSISKQDAPLVDDEQAKTLEIKLIESNRKLMPLAARKNASLKPLISTQAITSSTY